MYGSHSHCGSGYITYLICHVTLQDHVTTTLPDLEALGIVVVEIMFLIYHMASCDLLFKGLCNFEGGSCSY